MGGRAGQRGSSGPRPPNRRQGGTPPQQPRDDGLTYPLPAATQRAWQAHRGRPSQNPSLVFDRFAPDWHDDPKLKGRGLRDIIDAAKQTDTRLLAGWNVRWRAAAAAVGAATFTRTTEWRLITGLGAKGPLEVGFTFHRYGFPVLPGSSLKGLARAAAFFALAGDLGEEDLGALERMIAVDTDAVFAATFDALYAGAGSEARARAKVFRAVFGSTGRAGGAVFLDAIPQRAPALDLDIMNPHVPQYYQGSEPPTAWQNPNPVYFLTIAAGTTFCFAVGWRGRQDDDARRLRNQARAWLEQGLTELGVGAKTSAGYGYFAPAASSLDTVAAATATAVRPSPADAESPEPALEWRVGTVREFRPERGGFVEDDETKERLRFSPTALVDKGWSPANKGKVQYAVQQQDGTRVVVQVRRPR